MATLDGFRSRVPLSWGSGAYPSIAERDHAIVVGLNDSTQWDRPNRVPLGYGARQDASGRDHRFPQPALTQGRIPGGTLHKSMVPVSNLYQRQVGATPTGIQILDSTTPGNRQRITTPGVLGQTRVPLVQDTTTYTPPSMRPTVANLVRLG